MFSFHRPKVYRSPTGCCICKAKSSSSRFTDSKKYEGDFLECFQLSTPRRGEICNACVLLVKRWKKLPEGSARNWRHVVDARAGPGMKSNHKKHQNDDKKKKKKKSNDNDVNFTREYSPTLPDSIDVAAATTGNDNDTGHLQEEEEEVDLFLSGNDGMVRSGRSDDFSVNGYCKENGGSSSSSGSDYNRKRKNKSRTRNVIDGGENVTSTSSCYGNRRHKMIPRRRENYSNDISEFVDIDYWKMETVCCGTIFKGLRDELLIDYRFIKPCKLRAKSTPTPVTLSATYEMKKNEKNVKLTTATKKKKTNEDFGGNSSKVSTTKETPSVFLTAVGKSFSDSSSDSGYDDSSSNHGGGGGAGVGVIFRNYVDGMKKMKKNDGEREEEEAESDRRQQLTQQRQFCHRGTDDIEIKKKDYEDEVEEENANVEKREKKAILATVVGVMAAVN